MSDFNKGNFPIVFFTGQDFQVYKVAFSGQSQEPELVTDPSKELLFGHPASIPGSQHLLVSVCESLTGWSNCDVGVLNLITGDVEVIVLGLHF